MENLEYHELDNLFSRFGKSWNFGLVRGKWKLLYTNLSQFNYMNEMKQKFDSIYQQLDNSQAIIFMGTGKIIN